MGSPWICDACGNPNQADMCRTCGKLAHVAAPQVMSETLFYTLPMFPAVKKAASVFWPAALIGLVLQLVALAAGSTVLYPILVPIGITALIYGLRYLYFKLWAAWMLRKARR